MMMMMKKESSARNKVLFMFLDLHRMNAQLFCKSQTQAHYNVRLCFFSLVWKCVIDVNAIHIKQRCNDSVNYAIYCDFHVEIFSCNTLLGLNDVWLCMRYKCKTIEKDTHTHTHVMWEWAEEKYNKCKLWLECERVCRFCLFINRYVIITRWAQLFVTSSGS